MASSDGNFRTEQERFWAGSFGDAYIDRNQDVQSIATSLVMFSRVLQHTRQVNSVIEFGANIGQNMKALRQLLPQARLAAIEINGKAAARLAEQPQLKVFHRSILDFSSDETYDLTFTSGVLIHCDPAVLAQAYDALYQASARYVCVIEYYNPVPVEIPYRGHSGKLFKRDFAGELLDRFSDLRLVDYGFMYHRDPAFPNDDATWFLLEKF